MEFCPKDGNQLRNLAVEKPDALIGKIVDGRFLVTERLGGGGMGAVYKATQQSIGRTVAIKVLRQDLAHDDQAVKRFFLEAKASSLLSNPHTITIHDFGQEEGGLLYIAMELLEGHPLDDTIRMEWPMKTERGLNIAKQICDSLDEAHQKGIIHRDLKPGNIYLTRVGEEKDYVKVLDFGIAKIGQVTTQNDLTKPGAVMGTPVYMSPEQAMGNPVDRRADLYALGIILYEMLAGKPPFNAQQSHNVILHHINKPVPPLLAINPKALVFPELEMVVRKALEKKPEKRYQDAATFKSDLVLVMEKVISGNYSTTPSPDLMATDTFNSATTKPDRAGQKANSDQGSPPGTGPVPSESVLSGPSPSGPVPSGATPLESGLPLLSPSSFSYDSERSTGAEPDGIGSLAQDTNGLAFAGAPTVLAPEEPLTGPQAALSTSRGHGAIQPQETPSPAKSRKGLVMLLTLLTLAAVGISIFYALKV